MTPHPAHMEFFTSAAGAQRAGYRACKRCRPDASPGSPQWQHGRDVVARAMRLIADGVVDSGGVPALARSLGYSTRQLERLLRTEVGAGPLALARAQRAQTARTLIEGSALPLTEVAFAAGFASVRSFNATVRAVYASSPRELRARATGRDEGAAGTGQVLTLRLAFRPPLHAPGLFGHLAATAVPGVERWHRGGLERTLRLPHGAGWVRAVPAERHVALTLRLTDLRDLTTAVNRCRGWFDLDADPVAVQAALAEDPVLRPLVLARPGARLPRGVDPVETAVRAVLGQQVSTTAAARLAGRLALARPESVPEELLPGRAAPAGEGMDGGSAGAVPHLLFPTPQTVAALSDQQWPGLPRARRAAVRALVGAVAEGRLELHAGVDRGVVREQLLALPGIGPWSAEMIALRALGDPDAFPVTDIGVLRGAAVAGLPTAPRRLDEHARGWRPWRGYAVQTLWSTLDHPTSRLPQERA